MSSVEITQINTVAYPSWWAGATTVKVRDNGGVNYEGTTEGVEFLPQGLSIPQGASNAIRFIPWWGILNIERMS